MKIIIRLIAAPFLLCLMQLAFIVWALRAIGTFVKYGGEFITYQNADEETKIRDIYVAIKEQQKNQHHP